MNILYHINYRSIEVSFLLWNFHLFKVTYSCEIHLFWFFLLLTWLKIIIFRFCFFHDFFLKFHSLLEIFHSCSIKVLYFYIFYSYRYSIFSDLCFFHPVYCFSIFHSFAILCIRMSPCLLQEKRYCWLYLLFPQRKYIAIYKCYK